MQLVTMQSFIFLKLKGNIYRPQIKLQKGNVFTSVCQSFCLQGGCLPQFIHHHPWADTPPAQCMLGYTPYPVHAGIHPLPSACWDTHGYCCGRYTFYWNAFLFLNFLTIDFIFHHYHHSSLFISLVSLGSFLLKFL